MISLTVVVLFTLIILNLPEMMIRITQLLGNKLIYFM